MAKESANRTKTIVEVLACVTAVLGLVTAIVVYKPTQNDKNPVVSAGAPSHIAGQEQPMAGSPTHVADQQQPQMGLANINVDPSKATATIALVNGSVLTGQRGVNKEGTVYFTFYTDGKTENIRIQVPNNMVLVCTDDAIIEVIDPRGKSFIQSKQANPADYFTKAYGGAIVSLTNYPMGKLDIWCSAN